MDFFTTVGVGAIVALLARLLLGMHLAVTFLLVAFCGVTILLNPDAALSLIGETMYSAIATPTYTVLPLFVLNDHCMNLNRQSQLQMAICPNPSAKSVTSSFTQCRDCKPLQEAELRICKVCGSECSQVRPSGPVPGLPRTDTGKHAPSFEVAI